jgi:competence protein ComGC
MLKRNTKPTLCKKKKGQSTVEYIILVAAVIGAILVFVPTTFKNAFNSTLATGTNGMQNMAGRLQSSRPVAP